MKNKHALTLMQRYFKKISLGSESFSEFQCKLHQILTLEMIAKSIFSTLSKASIAIRPKIILSRIYKLRV